MQGTVLGTGFFFISLLLLRKQTGKVIYPRSQSVGLELTFLNCGSPKSIVGYTSCLFDCGRQRGRNFIYCISSYLLVNLVNRYYFPHFTDEETKPQINKKTCQKSQHLLSGKVGIYIYVCLWRTLLYLYFACILLPPC